MYFCLFTPHILEPFDKIYKSWLIFFFFTMMSDSAFLKWGMQRKERKKRWKRWACTHNDNDEISTEAAALRGRLRLSGMNWLLKRNEIELRLVDAVYCWSSISRGLMIGTMAVVFSLEFIMIDWYSREAFWSAVYCCAMWHLRKHSIVIEESMQWALLN